MLFFFIIIIAFISIMIYLSYKYYMMVKESNEKDIEIDLLFKEKQDQQSEIKELKKQNKKYKEVIVFYDKLYYSKNRGGKEWKK